MFEKMEEWALLYVTGFLPKGGPKIAIPPDTLIANQLIQRDTRVGTFSVPTRNNLLSRVLAIGAVVAITVSPPATAGVAGQWQDSPAIWSATCGYCHAQVVVGPVLFGRGLAPDFISLWVRSGQGKMPAFPASEISDAELQSLTDWINQQSGAEETPP
ncbi:MAG: hypothetical protein A3I78_06665 [Gammaproteobacteria bacterium RIFCSPLOWO2_02_FULL_56_15]|nr:MAG: hypothetical protein A3I78_06665 [Gammaproteobacteria bacterium RIFCSPLOWO2_02_FULL_56_15]